jgi:hypothetical protein
MTKKKGNEIIPPSSQHAIISVRVPILDVKRKAMGDRVARKRCTVITMRNSMETL